MDLPTCPSDDVDPVSGIQLPLTPRPTPERDEHALQDQQDDNTIVVIPRNPPGTTIGYPDLPERPDSPEPPAEPRQPKRTGKKDPALRHSEISADVERPELIIPQRTRGKRKEAYGRAVAKVGYKTGFHGAFATGASQVRRTIRQCSPTPTANSGSRQPPRNSTTFCRTAPHRSSPSPTTSILPLTWVWKYKTKEDGYLIKHKARLCVRGDLTWRSFPAQKRRLLPHWPPGYSKPLWPLLPIFVEWQE